jgi:hypothetical protein
VGCGSDAAKSSSAGADEADSSRLAIGSLCPSCQPSAGGESSDFEGDADVCSAFARRRSVSFDEARAAGFDMPRIVALVTREFTAPLRWSAAELDGVEPAFAAVMPPSGFGAETSIHGAVSAASEMVLAELDPARCDADRVCTSESAEPISCAFFLANLRSTLELTLQLDTADASIGSVSLSGRLWLARGDTSPALEAGFGGDLSLVQGTLRVGSGLPDPHLGSLSATLGFWPTAVRGVITPVIIPDERRFTDGTVEGEDLPLVPSWRYAPLDARWPGDACDPGELPIDAQTAEGRAALERMAAEYPAAQARVNGAPLFDASWSDAPGPGAGHLAQIGIELLGDPRPSCVASNGEPRFEVDVHAWSEDGRLDWTLPVHAELRRRPGQVPELVLYRTEHFASDAAFWSSSLRGVDLLGAPEAEVHLGASYGLEDASYMVGRLQVDAVPDCARDSRCPSSNTPDAPPCADCGTSANVVDVEWTK